MKLFVFFASLSMALATEFDMGIDEEGKKFTEKVKINLKEKTEEIVVPAHLDRAAVDVLNDFNVGLSARKMVNLKACFIERISKEDESPAKMDISMRLSKSKFPNNRFTVTQKKSVIVNEMSEEEVGKKIAAHCAGYKIVKTVSFEKGSINDAVQEMIKAQRASGKSKRDVVTTFQSCNLQSTNVIESCTGGRLVTSCKYRNDGRTCTYLITCSPTASGFNCQGAHRLSTLVCCDFACG
ncbi:uncharacterized protein LOC135691378 [Rhopilema esculentum]|uniref:uncharacterized protein LOC135691378 n=1 Tax=Rhopilema esculentum TaxID=499914 RepID=UPI0031DA916B